MKKVHVFTSAAFNYIPKVRMLFRSLRRHHPEFVLHLALADTVRAEHDLSTEPFDHLWPVTALDIPQWRGWAFCHNIVELSTAIKPFVLARLLAREDCAKVLYMDPDTVAFSRLDDLLEALEESNLVLTPHQTSPEATLAAVMDNEICSLKHGVYNLGFIGVAATPVGREFAAWWSDRVYHFCRADIPNGLFTDQRWIDLVPAFFPGVAIMRSPRHNVAPWNLTTRRIEEPAPGQYAVNGEPLGFYHFTGFDSGAHAVMSVKNSGADAQVRRLVDWYASETARMADDPLAAVAWAFATFTDGSSISRAQRLIYRERLDLQRAFPDPFDASGYRAWWESQGRIEYPDLFDAEREGAALARIAATLSAGFRADAGAADWAAARRLMRESIADPSRGLRLARRGWEILRSEGVGGLRRRLGG